jgi:hypothetical protein
MTFVGVVVDDLHGDLARLGARERAAFRRRRRCGPRARAAARRRAPGAREPVRSTRRSRPPASRRGPGTAGDAMLCSLRLDQPEAHGRRSVSRAKKAVAFFRISRSSRRPALLDLRPQHPAPQRLGRHRQLLRDRPVRPPAHPIQAHRLLRNSGERLFPLPHRLLPDACASIVRVSTRPGQLQLQVGMTAASAHLRPRRSAEMH